MNRTVKLSLTVTYNQDVTDAESVLNTMNILLNTALSTPGILDDAVGISEFEIDQIWDEDD